MGTSVSHPSGWVAVRPNGAPPKSAVAGVSNRRGPDFQPCAPAVRIRWMSSRLWRRRHRKKPNLGWSLRPCSGGGALLNKWLRPGREKEVEGTVR